jgi:hypothetical protein
VHAPDNHQGVDPLPPTVGGIAGWGHLGPLRVFGKSCRLHGVPELMTEFVALFLGF